MSNLRTTLLSTLLTLSLSAGAQQPEPLFDEAHYTPTQTTFTLNADPRATEVRLVLTANADADAPALLSKKMQRVADGRWTLSVKGDQKGRYYTFWVSRRGIDPDYASLPKGRDRYLVSPGVFAKAVAVGGRKGAVVDLRDTDPEGWQADRRPELQSPADLVVYELHHRDFSIDPSSGLVHAGKFLALTEPRALEHLQRLGVNAVHLLPSFDFASIDESRPDSAQYNWGYDPLNYNVPEGSYATNAQDPTVRIREFKQMVQALHRAGIRVVLDVVYNHTFNIAGSNFQLTYPDYYFRQRPDGTYSDGSGCGNETASERPLMRQFILESVRYWAEEYHIDGFRFDLMGVHDVETMRQVRSMLNSIDPSIFVYGEGWSAGQCALPSDSLAMKANMRQLPGVAAFCDDLRDALRGPFSDDTKGAFLAGRAGEEESIKFGIAGAIAHPGVDMTRVNYSHEPWATEPTQMMAYVSCHDDMCLTDRLRASIPGIQTDELIRLDLLAQTAVLTSQGVPFLLSGEEMLRDKRGVHNSFCSPDSVNHLDWHNLHRYPEVMDYYSRLIALRHSHPAFRLGKAELVREHLEFLPTQDCMVAYRLKDLEGIDPWKEIVVVLNANKQPATLQLPADGYQTVCSDGRFLDGEGQPLEGREATVAPQSALILHR